MLLSHCGQYSCEDECLNLAVNLPRKCDWDSELFSSRSHPSVVLEGPSVTNIYTNAYQRLPIRANAVTNVANAYALPSLITNGLPILTKIEGVDNDLSTFRIDYQRLLYGRRHGEWGEVWAIVTIAGSMHREGTLFGCTEQVWISNLDLTALWIMFFFFLLSINVHDRSLRRAPMQSDPVRPRCISSRIRHWGQSGLLACEEQVRIQFVC